MLGPSVETSPHSLPEALLLVDRVETLLAADPVFCRAMELDAAQLVGASPAVLFGAGVYGDAVQPALQRSFGGESVTHQIILVHPTLGPRQVSITYHPCAGADGAISLCAMILRDVTSEKLAHDSFVLYSQWREALNAIDRASISEQSLPAIAAIALERLRYLTPYRQAWIAVIEDLAPAASVFPGSGAGQLGRTGDAGQAPALGLRSFGAPAMHTAAGLYVMAYLAPGVRKPDSAAAVEDILAGGPAPLSLRLQVQGDYIGDLVVQPQDSQSFGPGQIEMMRELANRLERALHKSLLREKLSRYTIDLENAIAEHTQEIERRRQAADGLREILGYLAANRPLVQILNHIFRQAELLLGADAIAVFRPLDARHPKLLPERCIFAHSRSESRSESRTGTPTGNRSRPDGGELSDGTQGFGMPHASMPDASTSRLHAAGLSAADLQDAQTAVTRAVQEGRAVTLFDAPGAGRRYRAELVVPMLADHSVVGVIIFFFADDTDLLPEALELAVALGEQVVLATESALLQQRAQDADTLEERERLARELHDAVTQSIFSLTLFAEAGLRQAAAGETTRVREYLKLIGENAQQALKQLRLMLYELRPAVLEQVGIVQALNQRLDAVERRAGIDARLEVAEGLHLPHAVEESLYRICQEALNNAFKHASARSVVVRLRREGQSPGQAGEDGQGGAVVLEVVDDGVGFIPDQPGPPKLDAAKIDAAGQGLNLIRERVARLNAVLSLETAPGKGTTIRVTLQESEAGATTPWPAKDGAIHYDWAASHREPVGGEN